jgi:hypothetical protein
LLGNQPTPLRPCFRFALSHASKMQTCPAYRKMGFG